MKLLTLLDRKLFPRKTLNQIIEEQLQQAERDEMNALHTIKLHRFQAHMARSTIDALKAWDDREQKGGAAQ